MLKNKYFLGFIYILSSTLIGSHSFAASFDCSKASQTSEKIICGSPTLSTLDSQMASVYSKARSESSNPDALKQDQISWIKQVRACSNEQCIEQLYKQRIADLSPKTQLAKSPDPAQPSKAIVSEQTATPAPTAEVKAPEQQAQDAADAKEELITDTPATLTKDANISTPFSDGTFTTIGGAIITLIVILIPFIGSIKKSRKNV